MQRAAAGNAEALEDLIVEYLPELRGFVDRRMSPAARAREAVSDVVQSTCRELLTHRERFQFGADNGFRRWLFATALRKVLNKDRLHTRARRDVRRDGGLVALPDEGLASPSAVAGGHELGGLLATSLERLPESYRRVVLLSHLVGLSRREVATAMGRSEASVRNLLNRALAKLGADLGRTED